MSEMSERERVARLLIIQQIIQNLAEEAQELRRGEAAGLFTRVRQTEVPELDGVALGTVRLDRGASGVKVTDRRAFLAWVKEHNPTAIVTVEEVSTAWEKALLRDIKAGDWADVEAGELLPLPDGVESYASPPKLVVSPSVEGPAAVLAQLGPVAEVLGFAPARELTP